MLKNAREIGDRQHLPDPRPPYSPVAVLVLAVITASTSSIFIRFAQTDAPSLVIAAHRLTMATVILAPSLLFRHVEEIRRLSRHQITLILGAGFFLAVHFATWITSLEFTSVTSSVILVQTSPLFVALMTPLLLRERLPRGLWLGLALSLTGSMTIGLSDACVHAEGFQCPSVQDLVGGDALKGDLLALGGAISGAGYMILGRRMRGLVSLIPYIGLAYGAAAAVLITFMLLAGHSPFGYAPRTYLWFLLLALLPQLSAHSMYNWALRYLTAALVSISLLGEPVAASLLAYLLLDETPPGFQIIGGALSLLGILIAVRSSSDRSPQRPDTMRRD